jgi:hypothetical protein
MSFKAKWEKTENVVISERVYIILEIMSIKGYKMWINELSKHKKEFASNDI